MAEWDLVLGDCLEGMARMEDRSVDHTISDPPYSKDLYTKMRTNKGSGLRANGRPVARSEGHAPTSALQLASYKIGSIDEILVPVAQHLMRITKRWIIVFHDVEISHRWREAFGNWYLRTGVWVKTDPMPQVTGDRPAQGFEIATIAHRPGRKIWNGGGLPATWIYGTSKGDERPDHPCPKPEALMERLVRDFTDPGDLILDPFAGSGTTGVAALRNGRRFLGFERDPKYHEIATKRLGYTREQRSLAL